MILSIKKSSIPILLILFISTFIFSTQPLNATSFTEGDSGGGVGEPLNYGTKYNSNVNILQGSGYAYAYGEQIPGFSGEAWAWFWLANYWTCNTSGTYEIIMQWRYNGKAILMNHEFPLSVSTSSVKSNIFLFVELPNEISERPQSTVSIFSKNLNDAWEEETLSIYGTTELKYKAYFEKGKTYRLRGALEAIVFSRWIDGITWGSSEININGQLEKITISSDKLSVITSSTPISGGNVNGGGLYSIGETCVLSARAYDDFEFDYWSGDISGKENPKTFTVNKDIHAVANFKKVETIDFNIEVFSLDKLKYAKGETVKLYAKIKNTGTDEIPPYSAEASFRVTTPNGKLEDGGISSNTNSITRGGTTLLESSWKIPTNAETGCYDIEVVIKLKNGPTKSDKISNAFCLDICDSPKLTLFSPEIDGLFVNINGLVEPGCPRSSINSIHWDWGDGHEENNWFPASHKYERRGTYKISVTSHQSDGLLTERSFTVTVDSGDQLDVKIVAPITTVTSLPINFKVRITSNGVAISDAEVTFYQISPSSRIMGSSHSESDGTASYNDPQELEVGTTITWFAIAKKIGFQDGKSIITAFTYQPCAQLKVQIIEPTNVVTSTPITITVKVTCGGQPVSDVIVDFYQDYPDSRSIELGVITDLRGTATHQGFKDGLPPDYQIAWHAIAKKFGYEDGRVDGVFVHHYRGAPSVSKLLESPAYDSKVRVYGKVSLLGELFCPCFELTSGGEKILAWYDLMIGDNGTERTAVNVEGIKNGDWVVLTGELKQESENSSLNDFWVSSIEKID